MSHKSCQTWTSTEWFTEYSVFQVQVTSNYESLFFSTGKYCLFRLRHWIKFQAALHDCLSNLPVTSTVTEGHAGCDGPGPSLSLGPGDRGPGMLKQLVHCPLPRQHRRRPGTPRPGTLAAALRLNLTEAWLAPGMMRHHDHHDDDMPLLKLRC